MKNLTKADIIEAVNSHHQVLAALGVRSVGLFGSYVREQNTPQSDIDLLIDFDENKKTYDNFYEACCLLEKLLMRSVEVVTPDALSPYIKPYVMKEIEYVPFTS